MGVLKWLQSSPGRDSVFEFSKTDLPNRIIAELLGVDEGTIRNDLSGAEFSAPELPESVIGRDGKRYPPKKLRTVIAKSVDQCDAVQQPGSKLSRAVGLGNCINLKKGSCLKSEDGH